MMGRGITVGRYSRMVYRYKNDCKKLFPHCYVNLLL